MRLAWTAAILAAALVVSLPATAGADEVRDAQWHLTALELPAAHELSTGEGVKIGVIDTGIDARHPDLAEAVTEGTAFGDTDSLTDPVGTGTAVASVLAGRGHGQDAGVLGVAPGAQITSVSLGTGIVDPQHVAAGIKFLVDSGMDVITLTRGVEFQEAVQNAIANAAAADVVVVVAAGPGGGRGYTEAVTAIGTDRSGAPMTPIPEGADVTVTAPADQIMAAGPNGGYQTTSDAALAVPMVAGTLALVKERLPDLAGTDLIRHLVDSGEPRDGGAVTLRPLQALSAEQAQPVDGDAHAGAADGGDGAAPAAAVNTPLIAVVAAAGLLVQAALVGYARLAARRARRV
ncbi:subtilase family protein [Stackebrandtia albiflava]|uniref:Subtilase family protein n=1 Tax=Stackebrandtia albiflava TaxID=406432 RepID=A0A562UPT8_9ACTN|nr:S8 family serine peptidase [Stackebrandtia albiflava]TWJ07635.1 subtilase family protein [Stackebrandtia albiflava]